MTNTSGYMELVHECVICRGRFSDEELLRTHVCPAAPGNEFIELNEAPPVPGKPYEEIAPGAGSIVKDHLGILNDENKE